MPYLTFIFLLAFLGMWLATSSVQAQSVAQLLGEEQGTEKPKAGMHSMKITPTEQTPAPPTQQPESPAQKPLPTYKPLAPDEALIKEDNLTPWSDLQFAAAAHTKADAQKLTASIEGNRGAVPPQGLFLAAKAYADLGMMEQASVYFFVGKLRLSFDKARWPAQLSEADLAKLNEDVDKNKTEDQAGPKPKSPLPYDPHQGIERLSIAIGEPILSWAMKDPARLSKIVDGVREWDLSAPYAYDPGYDVGSAISFADWKKTLNATRTNYFRDMGMLASQLKNMHR